MSVETSRGRDGPGQARRAGRLASAAAATVLLTAGAAAAHDGRHDQPLAAAPASDAQSAAPRGRAWLAGDHHVHSHFSFGWKRDPDVPTRAPTPVLGGDSPHSIPRNAEMARKYGLAWMVSTDHGGPNHAKLNFEQAYPELLAARRAAPEVIQFYGLELNTPAADHSSIIIPHTPDERERLRELESRFDKFEAFPADPARDTGPKMVEALQTMKALAVPPVVIAHHPSRSARGVGAYGLTGPAELRDWNDAAPNVAVGMEGAPGHQAAGLTRDGSLNPKGARGAYGAAPTMGGFDQMAARVGGFWDAMLGEGRRWWITSNSDSHRHYTEGGADFWPGEYSKTYVHAARSHADILDGLRNGRVFVTTGDLVSELDVTAHVLRARAAPASIGGTLKARRGRDVRITIRLKDPEGPNHAGRTPKVARVDLIMGQVIGPVADRAADTNPTTRVIRRFDTRAWRRQGDRLVMTHVIRDLEAPAYIRVRGTSTGDLEPGPDPRGEDPWEDLWFYANPIFLDVE